MKRKIMSGLLVAATAAGVFASTSAFTAKRINQYVYVLSEDQMNYTRVSTNGQLPSEGSCEADPQLTPCNISYTSDKGSDLRADAIPAGGQESSEHGVWAQ